MNTKYHPLPRKMLKFFTLTVQDSPRRVTEQALAVFLCTTRVAAACMAICTDTQLQKSSRPRSAVDPYGPTLGCYTLQLLLTAVRAACCHHHSTAAPAANSILELSLLSASAIILSTVASMQLGAFLEGLKSLLLAALKNSFKWTFLR